MLNPQIAAAATTILWGFTYLLTTQMLPHHPFLVAAMRALVGAGFLLILGRALPPKAWYGRMFVLGTLNTGLFFGLFFIGVMRLPGGVAAIFQALSPTLVLLLAWAILRRQPSVLQFVSVILGLAGVTLVVLKANAAIDPVGVLATLGSTASLALGSVLMNRWGKPPVDFASFTGWQLAIGGVELAVLTVVLGDFSGPVTALNVLAYAILGVVLTGITFLLWFRAISQAGAAQVMPFILLTPVTAMVLDAIFTHLMPSGLQLAGVAIVIAALFLNQYASRRA